MQGIAFDFCRSTFMGFDQKPQRPAGQNLGRGVVERPAGMISSGFWLYGRILLSGRRQPPPPATPAKAREAAIRSRK